MKMSKVFLIAGVVLSGLAMTGCRRSGGEVWEDSKTAGHYMGRGMRSVAGKHGDSRQVTSRDQFGLNSENEDFVALEGQEGLRSGDREMTQSHLNPGDPSSGVPGIESFQDPSTIPELQGVFRNLHFDYDSSLVKGPDNMVVVRAIADYLKSHPNTYIFVEGHCDERGPQSYNFALGSHRSNSVRNLLGKEGVDGERVFTISYGKERPLVQGSGEQSFRENRRAQFKVYTR